MQSAPSSEFRIPDSELEGSVDLRVPSPQPARLTAVPSDKILFPRRMLYVEAVLYVTLAATAFGLGYLAGRGGSSAAKEDANLQMRGLDGKVLLVEGSGAKRGDAGAVVIVLPADKPPVKMPLDGLRLTDPGDARSAALSKFGGAAARADASGAFALSVPVAGRYHILILSRQATRPPDKQPDPSEIEEIGKYFDSPADLLQHCSYQWLTKDGNRSPGPIDVEFAE